MAAAQTRRSDLKDCQLRRVPARKHGETEGIPHAAERYQTVTVECRKQSARKHEDKTLETSKDGSRLQVF
jgi:hypothetical protein